MRRSGASRPRTRRVDCVGIVHPPSGGARYRLSTMSPPLPDGRRDRSSKQQALRGRSPAQGIRVLFADSGSYQQRTRTETTTGWTSKRAAPRSPATAHLRASMLRASAVTAGARAPNGNASNTGSRSRAPRTATRRRRTNPMPVTPERRTRAAARFVPPPDFFPSWDCKLKHRSARTIESRPNPCFLPSRSPD